MSDVVFGIPPEVLLTRASEGSVLPDLYFLFYRTASAACQDMSEVIVRAQVIQFGCLWNAVDKGTCFGSSCYGAFTIPGGNLSPEFAFKKEKAVMTYAIITVFSYVPSGNRTHN